MASYTGSAADSGRLLHLAVRRERQKEDMEKQKQKIKAENAKYAHNITDKFMAHYDAIEQQLKTNTIGLVTLDEMKAKREDYVSMREKQLSRAKVGSSLELESEFAEQESSIEGSRKNVHKRTAVLSFDFEDDDDSNKNVSSDDDNNHNREQRHQCSRLSRSPSPSDDGDSEMVSNGPIGFNSCKTKRFKIGKDPTVDTSFLPDREREDEENRLRESLRAEWFEQQARIKNEPINIAYSYWDGSGHRRDAKMLKGNTVHQFLQQAMEKLRKDFNELKTVSPDSLMFIKEDLIIPHFYTFYDFIVTKAMGKTGPLFEFDAVGELRIRMDATKDQAESHPAKVVLRSWYELNKHIYPASRWEPFDPQKKYGSAND